MPTIAELRALRSYATPGRWLPFDDDVKWDTPLLTGYDCRENHATPPWFATGPRVRTEHQAAADSRLIVAAVNSLPALLDVAEAAEQREDCFEHAGNCCDGWCRHCQRGVITQKRLISALARLSGVMVPNVIGDEK